MENVFEQIKSIPYEAHERRLILRDLTQSGFTVWGRFYIPYDASGLASVASLFDMTYDRLCVIGNGGVLDTSVAPILRHLGVYRTTLVTKHQNGQCSIADFDNIAPADFLGIDS